MTAITVRFQRLANNPDLPLPARQTDGSVGYDIASAEEDFVLAPGEQRFVSAGFSVELPPNIECQVRPRSGFAREFGVVLLYSPCTIDPDYRGEICAPLWNTSMRDVLVKRGTRIAQLVFQPACTPEVMEVGEIAVQTERGAKGFGSTGMESRP